MCEEIMDAHELNQLLEELNSDIDNELSEFFNNNTLLKTKFSQLIEVMVWEKYQLSDDIINKLDIITDDMDSFNFGIAKKDIRELRELLVEGDD